MSCCQCSNLGNRQNSYFSRLLGHWGGRIIPEGRGSPRRKTDTSNASWEKSRRIPAFTEKPVQAGIMCRDALKKKKEKADLPLHLEPLADLYLKRVKTALTKRQNQQLQDNSCAKRFISIDRSLKQEKKEERKRKRKA